MKSSASSRNSTSIISPVNSSIAPMNIVVDLNRRLYEAVRKNDLEKVKLFVKQGAQVESKQGKGEETAVYVAASRGHFQILKYLSEEIKANINIIKESDGTSPLLRCAFRGDYESCKCLLDAGADVNLCDKNGFSPLHVAAQEGHTNVCMLLCIHPSIKIDSKNVTGTTPLTLAVQDGRIEVIKVLIKYGANVNLPTQQGWTPLHFASSHGQKEALEILLNNAADPFAKTDSNKVPLDVAKDEISSFILQRFMMRYFVDRVSNLETLQPELKASIRDLYGLIDKDRQSTALTLEKDRKQNIQQFSEVNQHLKELETAQDKSDKAFEKFLLEYDKFTIQTTSTIQENHHTLKQDVAKLTNQTSLLEAEHQVTTTNHNLLKEEVTKLKNEVLTLQTEKQQLLSDVREIKTNISAMEERFKSSISEMQNYLLNQIAISDNHIQAVMNALSQPILIARPLFKPSILNSPYSQQNSTATTESSTITPPSSSAGNRVLESSASQRSEVNQPKSAHVVRKIEEEEQEEQIYSYEDEYRREYLNEELETSILQQQQMQQYHNQSPYHENSIYRSEEEEGEAVVELDQRSNPSQSYPATPLQQHQDKSVFEYQQREKLLREEIEIMKQTVQTLTKEIQEEKKMRETTLEKLVSNMHDMKIQNMEAEKKLEMEQLLSKKDAQNQVLQSKLENMEMEVKSYKDKYEEIRLELNAKVNSTSMDKNNLSNTIKNLENEILEWKRQDVKKTETITILESDNLNYTKKIQQLEGTAQLMTNQQQNLISELQTLQARVKDADFRKTKKEEENNNLSILNSNLKNEIQHFSEANRRLEEELQDTLFKKQTIENELNLFIQKEKNSQVQIRQFFSEIESLKKELSNRRLQQEQADSEQRVLTQQIANLKQNITEIEMTNESLYREKENLIKENKNLHVNLDSASQQITQLKQKVFSLETTNRTLMIQQQQQQQTQQQLSIEMETPSLYYNNFYQSKAVPSNTVDYTVQNPSQSNYHSTNHQQPPTFSNLDKQNNSRFTKGTEPSASVMDIPVRSSSSGSITNSNKSLPATTNYSSNTRYDSTTEYNYPTAQQQYSTESSTSKAPSTPQKEKNSTPFATEKSLKENGSAQEMENNLVKLLVEKDRLDGEYQKLQSQGMKTISSRKRRMEIEQRLEEIAKETSKLRLKLKQMNIY